MTEATTEAPAQSANGRAPAPDSGPDPDVQAERWLGVLVLAAGAFLIFVGLDRLTGGALTAPFYGARDAEG